MIFVHRPLDMLCVHHREASRVGKQKIPKPGRQDAREGRDEHEVG